MEQASWDGNLGQLLDRDYDQDRLDDVRRLVDAPDSDLFDVLGYILFTLSPKTRKNRADSVRRRGIVDFDGELKALLLAILKSYETNGENELATTKLAQYLTARYGSVSKSKATLGELSGVSEAYRRLQSKSYAD